MAETKYDGIIEAVHYSPDGKQVDWVRAYLRRGATWGDRVILKRKDLVDALKSGKKMAIGKRVEFMAGTVDISAPVKLAGPAGSEVVVAMAVSAADCDHLEDAPSL